MARRQPDRLTRGSAPAPRHNAGLSRKTRSPGAPVSSGATPQNDRGQISVGRGRRARPARDLGDGRCDREGEEGGIGHAQPCSAGHGKEEIPISAWRGSATRRPQAERPSGEPDGPLRTSAVEAIRTCRRPRSGRPDRCHTCPSRARRRSRTGSARAARPRECSRRPRTGPCATCMARRNCFACSSGR